MYYSQCIDRIYSNGISYNGIFHAGDHIVQTFLSLAFYNTQNVMLGNIEILASVQNTLISVFNGMLSRFWEYIIVN